MSNSRIVQPLWDVATEVGSVPYLVLLEHIVDNNSPTAYFHDVRV
jgi:hypothetical protein